MESDGQSLLQIFTGPVEIPQAVARGSDNCCGVIVYLTVFISQSVHCFVCWPSLDAQD